MTLQPGARFPFVKFARQMLIALDYSTSRVKP
jgi:hypothetical protein